MASSDKKYINFKPSVLDKLETAVFIIVPLTSYISSYLIDIHPITEDYHI